MRPSGLARPVSFPWTHARSPRQGVRTERRKVRHCGVDRPLRSQNCRITFEFFVEYFLRGSTCDSRRCLLFPELFGAAGREARAACGRSRWALTGATPWVGGKEERWGAGAASGAAAPAAPAAGTAPSPRTGPSPFGPGGGAWRYSRGGCTSGELPPIQFAAPTAVAISRNPAAPPRISFAGTGPPPLPGRAEAAFAGRVFGERPGGPGGTAALLRVPQRLLSSW